MTSIAVFGANGRMGKALIESSLSTQGASLAAALVRQGSPFAGIDAGEIAGVAKAGIVATENPITAVEHADVFIDFTLPESLMANLAFCVEHKKALVIGVTGLSADELAQIDQAAQHIPIVLSANFSVGINLMGSLLKLASQVMGDTADIEVFEAHHRFKKDAPSGTALKLGQDIADAMGWDLNEVAVYDRNGESAERQAKSIGFSTIRAGDIVGEHTVTFGDIGERIELTHRASSRLTFANGAVRAAAWLKKQPNGLYSMQDVLGLPQIT